MLLVILVFAAATYLAVRWMQSHGYAEQPKPRPTKPRQPTRVIAPDDDEGFLRELDRQRRQQPPDKPEA